MERTLIPNIQIKKSKINKTTYYDGSAFVELPQWIGYCDNHECTKTITDGRFCIGIKNSTEQNDGFSTNQGQVNAYFFLIENHENIKNAIIKSLKDALPNLLSNEYSSYDLINFPKLSDLSPEFDFKNYIGPSGATIEKDIKDNVAYISWHFYCLWDTEHGFEVITHKDRVIEIAPQADGFKIYEDNGTAGEVSEKFDEYAKQMKEKKKWWKFW